MATLTKEQVRQIIANAPAGTSPEGIVAALRETHQLEGYDSASPMPGLQAPGSQASLYSPSQSIDFSGLIPAAGGAVGGTAGFFLGGPPGAYQGAVLGGAGGEGIRQAVLKQKPSLRRMAHEGAVQGLFEIGGQGLSAGARVAGKSVMKGALRASKSLQSSFPDPTETVMSNRLMANAKGAAKATALREGSSQKLMDLLNSSNSAGKTFRTADVTRDVRAMLRDPVLPSGEKARIMGQLKGFLQDQGKKIDPPLLKEIKQFYQNRAATVYRAAKTGAPTVAQENRAAFSAAIAKGAKNQLETIPGVAGREAQTQSLIGAERAVTDASMRPPPSLNVLHPGTYPLLRSLSGPGAQSRLALFLTHPAIQELLHQSPRALFAFLDSVSPDATDVTP
jgi:hypothetical protein